jgi:CubicO group peptidase (beta-lactamase class C family)
MIGEPPVLESVKPEAVGLSAARLAHLSAVFRQEIEQEKLPGAVIMIARHGKLAYTRGLGKLDPQRAGAMPLNALFRIYSMTKPIVSVAILMLVEQGRILLSQPIAKWLPELADVSVAQGSSGAFEPVPLNRPITIHDLLRHTAGLTYEFLGNSAVHRQYMAAKLFGRTRTNAEFTQALASLPLLCQPGSQWTYSHATDVLGRLIEVISGVSLSTFLQAHIFKPLGMIDTSFHVPEAQHYRIAEPFERDPDSGSRVFVFDVRKPMPQDMAGAGLVSTAADYARFMQMLLSGGVLGETRLIGPKTVQLMTADHLGSLPIADDLLAAGHGFGLGVAVRLAAGVASGAGSAGMYYWGGLAGTSFFIDPQEGLQAQLMIQQPGRREHYRQLFRELVYAAIIE